MLRLEPAAGSPSRLETDRTKILIVDEDRDLVDLLAFVLNRAGMYVLPAGDAATGMRLFEQDQPDLALLEVNLRPENGFALLKRLRARSEIPIIIVSARSAEDDKIQGLELGADDYLTKPFSYRELIARIRARLRRRGEEPPAPSPENSCLTVGPITANVREHTVTKAGRLIKLSQTEFRLLQYLMVNAGAAVPSRSILRHVWGHENPTSVDLTRVAIYRLRRKIEDDPRNPRLLQTVPGVGFMLKPETSRAKTRAARK